MMQSAVITASTGTRCATPQRQFSPDSAWTVPSVDDCTALWERFAVPEHIQKHCQKVAHVATSLAKRAVECGMPNQIAAVQASALLHDVAKMYCVDYGGSHAQEGAAWVLEATGNHLIAQGVMHHVWWPWDIDLDAHFLPLAVQYADKRVRHDSIVSIDERFSDLMVRYGSTDLRQEYITASRLQADNIERALSARLEWNLSCVSF